MGGAELQLGQGVGYAQVLGATPEMLKTLGLATTVGSTELGAGQMVVGARVLDSFYDPRRGTPVQMPSLYNQTVTLQAQRWNDEGEMSTRSQRLRVAGVLRESGPSDYQVFIPTREVEKLNEWFAGKRIDRSRAGV